MGEQINWIIKPPVIVPEQMQSAIGGYPLVAETLYRHGIRDIEEALAFLDPNRYQPVSADELPDIQEAYALLSHAIQKGQVILVWGDFDVDGQTSTTLLVEGLRSVNGNVIYHVPIRAKDPMASNAPSWRLTSPRVLICCSPAIRAYQKWITSSSFVTKVSR